MNDFFGFNEPSTKAESEVFCEGLQEAVASDVEDKINSMSPEECQEFVRDFTSVMMDWQPQITDIIEDGGSPVSVAVGTLFLAKMFPAAFDKAYVYTDKIVSATTALKKALGE